MHIKSLILFIFAFALCLPVKAEQIIDPGSLEGRQFDVIVVGATPGGLATAIRASREGLSVLVVNHTNHIGGMLTNGLGLLDTEYYRARSPIYDEMTARMASYDSGKPFDRSSYVRFNIGERLRYEPHVIENILNQMVAEEQISILSDHYPAAIIKTGNLIEAVRFRSMKVDSSVLIRGRYFVDAMYEGDFAALAGVPTRVGRESRDEYREPHAGVSFTYLVDSEERPESIKDLRVHMFRLSSREIPHPRNGEGDNAIQAYNFRLALSRDPANRYIPPIPDDYDPEAYQVIKERLKPVRRKKGGGGLKTIGWNVPILPGGNYDYPNASWPERRKITQRHLDWAIGILHYLQKDLPEPILGLARDEFVDNNHVPYEMYVREARRIKGLKVFTELDGLLSKDFNRAPIHAGSIAITEWAIDSHACTIDRYQNSRAEGKVLLAEQTVPGQVDFKCLLSQEATNLIVPVCLSSTHVGWGTIRLEPTWMHIGESVGFALAIAKENEVHFIDLDIDKLQRKLAQERILLAYFDDVELIQPDTYVPALQYLGTKGFFPTYKARAEDPLTSATARIWLESVFNTRLGKFIEPNKVAKLLAVAETKGEKTILNWKAFIDAATKVDAHYGRTIQELVNAQFLNQTLTRAKACEVLYLLLGN